MPRPEVTGATSDEASCRLRTHPCCRPPAGRCRARGRDGRQQQRLPTLSRDLRSQPPAGGSPPLRSGDCSSHRV